MARLRQVRRDGRAISPVIATVIIVAIAIAIAIAVAFWAVGLTGIFTRYEEVKVTSAYAESDGATPPQFTIKIRIKNTGSADATLDDCFINGKPWDAFTATGSCTCEGQPIGADVATNVYTIKSGATANVDVVISPGDATSGQTLDIKLHTAAGRDYPRAVVLP